MARVNASAPEAWCVCDRCAFVGNRVDFTFQHDWRGNQLANIRVLVCPKCLDVPFENNRPLILPPDPPPVLDARPELFDIEG